MIGPFVLLLGRLWDSEFAAPVQYISRRKAAGGLLTTALRAGRRAASRLCVRTVYGSKERLRIQAGRG